MHVFYLYEQFVPSRLTAVSTWASKHFAIAGTDFVVTVAVLSCDDLARSLQDLLDFMAQLDWMKMSGE